MSTKAHYTDPLQADCSTTKLIDIDISSCLVGGVLTQHVGSFTLAARPLAPMVEAGK